jgi:hypothetical protein
MPPYFPRDHVSERELELREDTAALQTHMTDLLLARCQNPFVCAATMRRAVEHARQVKTGYDQDIFWFRGAFRTEQAILEHFDFLADVLPTFRLSPLVSHVYVETPQTTRIDNLRHQETACCSVQ